MSVNLAKDQLSANSFRLSQLKRIFFSFPIILLCLLILIVLTAWLIWTNPIIFASRIESALAESGVSAEIRKIENIQSEHCGLTKPLCFKAELSSVSVSGTNFKNISAYIETEPLKRWHSLLSPKLHAIDINVGSAQLNIQDNQSDHSSKSESLKQSLESLIRPIRQYLPKQAKININRLKLSDNLEGVSASASLRNTEELIIDAEVYDRHVGELRAKINLDSGNVILNVDSLDSSSWLENPVNVQTFTLEIDLNTLTQDAFKKQDFSGVQGSGIIQYDDINLQLSVRGSDEKVAIEALPVLSQTQLEPISITISNLSGFADSERNSTIGSIEMPNNEATFSQNAFTITINSLPLSWVALVKPLLPNAELIPTSLSGKLTGTVELDFSDGVSLSGTSLRVDNLSGSDDIARFDNLSLKIQIDEQHIYLQASFAESRFDIPALFPVRGKTYNGIAFVRYDTDSQILVIDDASLSNQDFNEIFLYGEVALANSKKIILKDLNIEVVDFKAKQLIDYVAKKNVSNGFYSWLDQALIKGDFSGKVYLNGAIKGFFVSDAFSFNTDFKLSDFVLSYLPNNPPLSMRTGEFHIKNRTLTVKTRAGKIVNVPVSGRVKIADILAPKLDVNLSVPPSKINALTLTAGQSLAKPVIDKVLEFLDISGRASLTIALVYDLTTNEYRFDILLTPLDATIVAKAFKSMPIKHAKGEISINEAGFNSMRLTGEVAGQPLKAVVNSEEIENQVIKTTGKIDVVIEPLTFVRSIPGQEHLAQALDNSAVINGRAGFTTDFTLHGAELKQLTANSDLKGAEIQLFDILQKRSHESVPLSLNYQGDVGELNIELKDRFAVKADFNDMNLDGLTITDSVDVPMFAESGEIAINLRPDNINVDQIMQFVKALGKRKQTDTLPFPFTVQSNISAQTLDFGLFRFKNVTALGDLDSGLQLDSDLVKGFFLMKEEVLSGHIERVSVDRLLNQVKNVTANKTLSSSNKTQIAYQTKKESPDKDNQTNLPTMKIKIDQFLFRDKNLGRASFLLSKSDGLNVLDELHLTGEGFFLNISGYEALSDSQNVRSYLQGTLKVDDIKKRLALFTPKEFIYADSLDVEFSVQYVGRLTQFDVNHLVGNMNFNSINVGSRSLDTTPTGILKIFDWESLVRRIRLDLDLDLFSLNLDVLAGAIFLDHGILTVRQLDAKTALADIKARGDINLKTRRFDGFMVTVLPKPSDLLPVIGALASGGLGFMAGIAIDGVAGHPLNQILSLRYALSGDLLAPKINVDDYQLEQKIKAKDVNTSTVNQEQDRTHRERTRER